MSVRAAAWLRDLQGAVATCRLYPADHPRVTELMARLSGHVDALTTDRHEFSVFLLDDRLVSDDGFVESTVPLARGVFASLQAHGFDRVTVTRGANRADLSTLVQQLADDEPGATPLSPLSSTPRLRLSRLVQSDATTALQVDSFAEGRVPLVSAWQNIAERGTCELDVLEGMVLAFGQQLRASKGAIAPLARLTSHDAYTVTHIANVALLAMAAGEAFGMDDRFVHDLGLAALLHDIGKLRVPLDVLNAPGRLNEAQLALMKKHPEDGARLLMATPDVPDLAVLVAFEHHMDANGGGYPVVAAPWRISLASAITHIADVYDALRSDRPYRKGLAPEVVAQMMLADAGTCFDAVLLQSFFERVVPRLLDPPTPTRPESPATISG